MNDKVVWEFMEDATVSWTVYSCTIGGGTERAFNLRELGAGFVACREWPIAVAQIASQQR